MIDLYYCGTPNGLKMKVFFEETGLPHRIIPVDLGKGDQFKPEFLRISPNNKIPAMVDHDPVDGGEPIALFESGAMLLYLADKIGRFLSRDLRGRNEVIKWLFWQVGGLGPMAGQIGHFNAYAPEKIPYAIERYARETHRLYSVLNTRLATFDFIVGDYSIADMACYPWIVPHKGHGQSLEEHPHLKRWFETIARRPAVVRAYVGTKDSYSASAGNISEEERRILFGTSKRKAAS
ncbi:glutathione binding-like protein [Taklimakanibacter deserti]|uniref:glutathione binding-like protein n=1 Tax=Taklimakanibacter deserti TaxID=2267839 RepID=UPI000E65668A